MSAARQLYPRCSTFFLGLRIVGLARNRVREIERGKNSSRG
jgi:hypothetical protein